MRRAWKVTARLWRRPGWGCGWPSAAACARSEAEANKKSPAAASENRLGPVSGLAVARGVFMTNPPWRSGTGTVAAAPPAPGRAPPSRNAGKSAASAAWAPEPAPPAGLEATTLAPAPVVAGAHGWPHNAPRAVDECRMASSPSCFPRATSMRHQGHIKAPSRRVGSHLIGTPRLPQGYHKATLRLQQGSNKVTCKAEG
jgi:hypothetical protein